MSESEVAMKTRLLAGTLLLLTFALPIGLRTETFPYDHMHLAVPDPAKAVEWYIANLGAKHGQGDDRVVFGRTIFAFTKAEHPQPSAGSAIDHVGFSVADVDGKMKQLQGAGAKLVAPVRDVEGLFKFGFLEDPWGVKLELVQDPETPGFHHIHLLVADPEASLKWYVDTFGGDRIKLKGRLDAVKYSNPNVWLLALKGDGAAPSQGHAIDHLGWAVANVGAKVADLTTRGAKPTEPRPVRNLSVAFVDAPGGVRVEMVQGRTDEELTGR
jgi:catechol 2,3-dioxygenase-like lactoylglutathione lyase family enzyme